MLSTSVVHRITSFGVIRETVVISLLIFLGFLIYSNTKEAPFTLDDGHNIVNNHNIRIENLSLDELGKAGFKSPIPSRPVANISFAINHYLHEYNVKGFRFFNVLVHVLTGIFLYFFIRDTLHTPALKPKYGKNEWLPVFAAILWMVHPIQTQSVTYIVQRMNCLSSMFYILAMWMYTLGRIQKSRRKKIVRYTGCLLSGIMSLGSKEIAATLPFFIFIYEWYFFQQLGKTWLNKQAFPFRLSMVFLAALTFSHLGSTPLEALLSSYETTDFSLGQRLMTQSRVIFFYLGLIFYPHPSRLNLDHHILLSSSLTDPMTTILSILGLIMIFAGAVFLAKRDSLLSFCLLWFLGNLVIESSIIALEIAFEHRVYLPSMMLILMTVVLVGRLVRQRKLRIFFLCSMVVISSLWTYQRNQVWQNEVSLWEDSAHKSPHKARPNNNLAVALVDKGEWAHASEHFKTALKAKPYSSTLHKNMGNLMMELNRPDAAVHHYKWASRIKPDNPELHFKLGGALMVQENYVHAMRSFSQALMIKPDYKQARWKLETIKRKKTKGLLSKTELDIQDPAVIAQDGYVPAKRDIPDNLKIKPNYKTDRLVLGAKLQKNKELSPSQLP